MKRILVVVQICVCICLLYAVSGRGQSESFGVSENEQNNTAGKLPEKETPQPEPENEICHLEKDITLNDSSVSHIKLCSRDDNRNPVMVIDDSRVPFPDGDKVVYEPLS